MTSATSLTLDTPAQTTPNTAITLTGTYQGDPQSLDYNFGTGWIQASSVAFSSGTFSFTVPAGIGAGSYTPQIRDHSTPTVTGTAGTFVVSAWTPSTLTTSPGATPVFEFNANNPAAITLASNGTVQRVVNSLNPSQSLTAEVATGNNAIVIADNSGADGTRRLLQFHPTTISPGTYDPSTNWLGAGGINGSAGSALVDLANSANVSTIGSFTAIIALDISASYTYAAGPIWGSLATPGPLQYAQIRYNRSAGAAGGQLYDSSLSDDTLVGAAAQGTISAGWHVMTMIKNGGTITYRLDGQVVATAQLTTTLPFTASDFMIGGGFPPASSADAGRENGVPPPYVGEFQAYSGILAGTDLANAEELAGNAIGLSLGPTVSTSAPTPTSILTLDTPAQATPNSAITFTGTYTGNPQALDYNLGAGWVQASLVTFSNGIFAFTAPAGTAAGTYTPQVRDHNATSVVGTAGTFVVSAWTPSTLSTSPGASAVFEFNANNPAAITLASNGTVQRVANSLNSSQSLTAEVATGNNAIVIEDNSGADGTRRLLQFHPTTISPNIYDPSTNWLGAGGINGSAGSALVDLANSANVSTSGSFTAIIALDINTSYSYAAGPIWGSLATPGPLQYAQIRYNRSVGAAGGQLYDSSLSDSNLVGAAAQGTISAGWHVMTMIKNGGTITYRLDGQVVATAQLTTTLPFTASDFMIGGGFPPASSADAGRENGVPPPYVGEFQAYSGILAGTDLANAEELAGNAIGLSLSPTVSTSAPTPTISLSAPGTVQEPSVGAGVTVPLTVTTTNLRGDIYYEVLTASGGTETSYTAALPIGAAITVPTTIPQQKSGQAFSVQVAFNYVPIRANLKYSSSSGGVNLTTFASNTGISWDATGQIATIPIYNVTTAPHYFQVEDTTTSTPLQSATVTYQIGSSGGGGTVTVAAPTPVATTQIFAISPHLAHTGDVVQVANAATSPTVTATSSPVTITDPTGSSILTLDTPAQATPNSAITFTGTYTGNPQALDYNLGAGWVQASSVTFSNGIFTFTAPAGTAAGTYTPQVRDHNATSVVGTAGTFLVSAWTPSTLSTSPGASAVFEFNANNPSVAAVGSNGTVQRVENSLNTSQSLTAEVASGGNGIVIANNAGADGTRRLLQFHATKINPNIYDPSTNWLGAGGVNGSAGSQLVDLANSANLSTSGSFTTIIALDINKSYDYAAGPIWGSSANPGPVQYAQIRYNGLTGAAGGQIYDSSLTGALAQSSTVSAGWHVMTMIKSGDTLTYRLDGQQVATATVTSKLSFTANDFMIGGGFGPGVENGVPPDFVGEFQAYSGALAGTDLANAEQLAGNSIGLLLNPTVPDTGVTVSAATIQQQSQTPQTATLLASSATAADTVTVNQPTGLAVGLQTITGIESDPSQSIFLDWRTYGTPTLTAADWVQAKVDSTGHFSASVTIDHPGIQSTMFYRIGQGSAVAAWSATPSGQVA